MAKKQRLTKPGRDADPLVKSAWLWEQYEREFARLMRSMRRLDKLRQSIKRQGVKARKGT